MTDGEFQKVSRTDKPLYGPRKLLLCGFAADAQFNFITLLDKIGLAELPLVWVTEDQADLSVGELVRLANGTGTGLTSQLPRAVIMSGITQKELHLLMSGSRQSARPSWVGLSRWRDHPMIPRKLPLLPLLPIRVNSSTRSSCPAIS